MLRRPDAPPNAPKPLDAADRVAIAYLVLPLVIFLVGWFEWWVALPLVICVGYALAPLAAPLPGQAAARFTPLQICVAIAVGCAWALFGGAGHLLFANPDWHVRDAVLHDLVTSPWPVGYGLLDGKVSLLRAPLAFYLPAALIGKSIGLPGAHVVMGIWTASGASLFLLQAFSLVPSRAAVIALAATVVVLFSGFDIIGNIINTGPRFLANWNIAQHLEWWAGRYQYSSMTTQLFWVPNHALGGWLMVGLILRHPRFSALDAMLPLLVVAAALWSPLSALGVVPFVLWRAWQRLIGERRWRLLHPRVWLPALCVGVIVASYLVLDPGGIAKGVSTGTGGALDTVFDLLNQTQFFLLEAGFIGFAILWICPTREVVHALLVLALLPLAYLGPANDLVMRGSIPALAVLALGACVALSKQGEDATLLRKKLVLLFLLAVGAVTPLQEFARSVLLPAWPINLDATLIGANCGTYPPHYVARLSDQAIRHVLRVPRRVALDPASRRSCDNPAIDLMLQRNLL